jgi:hypothetical protein
VVSQKNKGLEFCVCGQVRLADVYAIGNWVGGRANQNTSLNEVMSAKQGDDASTHLQSK